ncbi:hypothetical protein ADICYQ_0717 [Cyclobacterium qasimii M12-11B]|uniref:Uncharacterized protein n=2 Tax=Cyclobacterium qasimii TaxID=1350429 RepID=S7WW35_9BACT|nr:hypothetical protein ADICYQ_0717 [Cyclobacterium qasimii M12-11B]
MLQMRLYLLLLFGFQMLFSEIGLKINNPTKNEGKVLIHPNRPLNWDDFKRVDLIGDRSTINAITQSTCEIDILKITQKKEYVTLVVNVKINLQKELSQVKNNFFNTRDEQTKKESFIMKTGIF